MSGRAAIVSLRFNAAFIQHLIAYAKAVSELGMEAEFLLDPPYSRFPELVAAAPIVEFRGFPVSASWDCAILLNPAVNNRKLGLELKRSGTKILYVYHEPWHMSLDYLRNEGISSAARAILAHRMTVPVLRLADTVILESHFGLEIYRSGDFRHNPKAVYFPQIYDDDTVGRGAELISQKQFFSFIGNPCRAHGFDQYLAAIRHALSSGMDVRFLIASRFALPDSVHRDPLLRQNADRLEFRCGQPLNNDEMNRCYAESFCVWICSSDNRRAGDEIREDSCTDRATAGRSTSAASPIPKSVRSSSESRRAVSIYSYLPLSAQAEIAAIDALDTGKRGGPESGTRLRADV